MAGTSNIEWTDSTWNPIVGCSIVSPGCTNCYAMSMAARIEAMNREARNRAAAAPSPQYDGTTKRVNGKAVWARKVAMAPDSVLTAPLRWTRARRVFVNSMGDLFHEAVPDAWIDRVFAVMATMPRHTFQVLTKRAERMRAYVGADDVAIRVAAEARSARYPNNIRHGLTRWEGGLGLPVRAQWPLPNVWLGVSAERQEEADARIPALLDTPAAIRLLSCEPLLGPINLTSIRESGWHRWDALRGLNIHDQTESMQARIVRGAGLDWIIVGGESGHAARPMHPDWARSLRDQCAAAGVPFFFKQWGEWLPGEVRCEGGFWRAYFQDGSGPDSHGGKQNHWWNGFETAPPYRPGLLSVRVGKKAAGRMLDGVEHDAMPAGIWRIK